MTLGELYDALNGLRDAVIECDRAKGQFERDEYTLRNEAKRDYYEKRKARVEELRALPVTLTSSTPP